MRIVSYADHNILRILKEFRGSFYNSEISDKQLNSLDNKFKQFAIFRVLLDRDEEIGFYSLYANDKITRTAFLSMIVVRNDKQGFGYGKQLLCDCVSQSKLNGMLFLRLEVNKMNKKGIAFYNKFDFEIICENEMSFLMERKL